jgi:hypothetical protein
MNEFQQLPNPDNVPGKVSSGYQRQNTNMFAIQTGLDTTEPHDNGNGVITIPKGGIVELNGVMFKLTATITLTKPIPSRAYWVAIEDNGEGAATAELVEYPGTWSPDKKGCYLTDGRRTLNWVSLGSLFNPAAFATVKEILLTKSSETIQLKPGWYHVYLESGAGGGNGQPGGDGVQTASSSTPGGVGGQGGSAMNRISKDKIFFFDKSGQHEIKTGGDGTNGGSGGKGGAGLYSPAGEWKPGGGGGGGASGSGEFTSFDNFETGEVPCGEGGRGGAGGCTGGGGAGVPGGTLPNDNAYNRMRDGRTGGADNGGDGGGGDKSGVSTSTGGSNKPENSALGGRGGRGGGSLTGAAGASGINGANGVDGGGGGGGGKGLDGKYRPNGVSGGSCVVRGISNYGA